MEKINNITIHQTKSAQSSPYVNYILSGKADGSYYTLTPAIAYWLYEKSDCVADAVGRISWAFEQMDPVLIDVKTNDVIDDHPLLTLLDTPGPMQSGSSLMFELMVSFLITGECYPIAIGNTSFEPIALYTIKANKISLVEGVDGWLESIIASANYDQNKYNRQLVSKRSTWIYQRRDNLAETIQILIQRRKEGLRAQSPLDTIYYQACTKYFGNMHNSSIVKQGSRPGGLWSPDGKASFNQDQYEAFQNEINTKFSGPSVAGRNIVSPVAVKYENFLLNTRDMDFINLIEQSGVDVYNQYKIPLPLVSKDTMTLNNFQKATEALYDFAVLPPAKFLLKQIGKFLLSRYKNSENLVLGVNEKQLQALKERLYQRAKSMRESSVFSDNEIRNETGYESLGIDGDIVYKPSTLVPSGQDDDYLEDQIIKPGDDDEEIEMEDNKNE